jgi:hypothetical protein
MGFDKKIKKMWESADETLMFVVDGIHNEFNKVIIAMGAETVEG